MTRLERLQKIKSELDEAKEQTQREAGALDELMRTLRKEFKCKTLSEGEALLKRLTKEMDASEAKLEAQYTKFKRRYKDDE